MIAVVRGRCKTGLKPRCAERGGPWKSFSRFAAPWLDPAWLGHLLGVPSFAVMRTLFIAAIGEPLEPDELSTFTRITGRAEEPSEPADAFRQDAGNRHWFLSKPVHPS
jgi:hypothetical protein